MGLTVVPLYETVLFQNITMASTSSTSLVQDIRTTRSYAVQFIWNSTHSPIGTFQLLGSNDNINFTIITDSIASVSQNSGSILINVETPAYQYVKAQYVPISGGGAGDTNTCTIAGKQ
jgi:hypothetical protein